MRDRGFSRRSFLGSLCTIPFLLVLPSGVVRAARLRIRALRHWPEPERSRLVLDVDGVAQFQAELLEVPWRIRLRIHNAELLRSLEQSLRDDPLVSRIHSKQADDSVEILIDLQRPCELNSFSLPPNIAGKGHRVVLDISPKLSRRETEAREVREARHVESVRGAGDRRVVAIDAGHGGEDPGTVWGRSLQEKAIALDVSRLVAAEIDRRPGMRAVLTRGGDYFVPLSKRQQIAKRYAADIFVSIHVNAAHSRSARGAEVFFLSLKGAVDKAARELIDRENAADLVGGVSEQALDEPIVDILVGMTRDRTMKQSERLAGLLLRAMRKVPGGAIRGVKQGPLAVLKSIEKPSVLVELGFFTNVKDRRLLASDTAQREYARRLVEGIQEYFS